MVAVHERTPVAESRFAAASLGLEGTEEAYPQSRGRFPYQVIGRAKLLGYASRSLSVVAVTCYFIRSMRRLEHAK
jgi:hypothetical protein